jgi:hypothetical protein
VKGKRGKMHKQLLDVLEEKRGYWKLRDEALDRCGELALEEVTDLS